MCGGSGPKDKAIYQYDGVDVALSISRFSQIKNHYTFYLEVQIPLNKTLSLLPRELFVNGVSYDLSGPKAWDSKTRKVVTVSEPISGNINHERAIFTYHVSLPANDELYTVTVPAITINKTNYKIPAIQFVRKQGQFVSPLNC
jgi:hypothetical protein